jgi:hypothetical protein
MYNGVVFVNLMSLKMGKNTTLALQWVKHSEKEAAVPTSGTSEPLGKYRTSDTN